ncbi:unnamed protein product [Gadus morhua 'NCC']
MAEENPPLKHFLTCSVCTEILKDPVSLSCHHSFCSSCLNDFWALRASAQGNTAGRWSGEYTQGTGQTMTLKRTPERIRVQLDYDGGEVSFYDPEDMTLIYTHQHTFTDNIFPYFGVGAAARTDLEQEEEQGGDQEKTRRRDQEARPRGDQEETKRRPRGDQGWVAPTGRQPGLNYAWS